MSEPLEILFEDAHCLAAVKLAGLLTQGRAGGEPTLEDAVRRHLNPGAPASVYLGCVHRLDRPVSGVVVWAKTPKAARRLASQFEQRAARKEYWAIAEGDPPAGPGEAVWEDYLADPGEAGIARVVAANEPGARHAVTRVRVGRALTLPPRTCWLLLRPETGRTHQLRAQSSSRGLPILGDAAYGSARPFPSGIALHARALRLVHPIRRTPLTWTAPVPSSWREAGVALPEAEASA